MPEITDTTAREAYTIAGKTFNIFTPYSTGHVLTAGEASQLNQVFAENIRNNFAGTVKKAEEAGTFDQDVLQGSLDDYMSSYEMGVRTGGGGRSGDPVMQAAMDLARDLVRQALSKKFQGTDQKLADVKAATISQLAKEFLDRGDDKAQKVMEVAKARVEAAKGLEGIDIGASTLPDETEAENEATAAAGKRRAAPTPAPEPV